MSKIESNAEITPDGNVEVCTLYELNKQGYENILPYTEEAKKEVLDKVANWFVDKKYAMLLCNERRDYTVFNFVNELYNHAAQVDLRECLDGRGATIEIKYDESMDAFEIWIRIDGEIYMYYLFECRDFIIEIGVD